MAALFLSDAWRKRLDRSPALKQARWRLEAGVLGLFWLVCAALEPRSASALGRRLLRAIGPSLAKSKHVERNLQLAFPGLDATGRRALVREVWGNTGAVLGEYPHLKVMCHEQFDRHFERVEKSDLADYRSGKRYAIFAVAHLGNWEVSAATAIHLGIPVTTVYAPSRNPYIDRMLLRRRGALGCNLISRADGPRPLLRELAEGRSVGLVVDARDDSGVPIPFFGMPKLTTLAPARLALRFGCDLIPTRVERLGDARFRVTSYEPVRPDPALAEKDQATQMMAEVNRLFEQWICARPQDWMCIKRAWPKEQSIEGDAQVVAGRPASSSANTTPSTSSATPRATNTGG